MSEDNIRDSYRRPWEIDPVNMRPQDQKQNYFVKHPQEQNKQQYQKR